MWLGDTDWQTRPRVYDMLKVWRQSGKACKAYCANPIFQGCVPIYPQPPRLMLYQPKEDNMTEKSQPTLYEIALVKSYAFTQEYNPVSGQAEDKHGYRFLKEGYIAGFMAGFAHKMGGGHD